MATYTIDKRPTRLRDGDKVIFVVGGARCEYSVVGRIAWLPNDGGNDVFEALGMTVGEKISMAERCFGYTSTDPSSWPSAKLQDDAAHCRLVNALYDLIEERDGKKAESRSDKATDEPGIFLGYGWAPADAQLGHGFQASADIYESIDDACEQAALDGYDTCLVFKVYAVDVKKYTRKFVQED